jgi:hypothetical protein
VIVKVDEWQKKHSSGLKTQKKEGNKRLMVVTNEWKFVVDLGVKERER